MNHPPESDPSAPSPRVVVDSCLRGRLVRELRAAAVDCLSIGEAPQDGGDAAVLAQAAAERRVLITLDKDFGELAVLRSAHHSGIIRLVGVPVRQRAEVCRAALRDFATDLAAGAIVTLRPGHTRIRPPGRQ